MAIELDKEGKVVSCYFYKIAKKADKDIRFPVEFQYIGEDIESEYFKGRLTIDSILYADDEIRTYNSNIRFFRKDNGKETLIESETPGLAKFLVDYTTFSDISYQRMKHSDKYLPRIKITDTYESAKQKTDTTYDYVYTLPNGVDFVIPEIPKELVVSKMSSIIDIVNPDTGNGDSRYIIYGNRIMVYDLSQENDSVIEFYDFEDKDNPIIITLEDFEYNSKITTGCPNINFYPRRITCPDKEIDVEYDDNGLMIDSSDKCVAYTSTKLMTLSLHPLYHDDFNTHLGYNGKLFVVDQFVDDPDDERFAYYTRLIVEVESPDQLLQRIKDEESVRGIDFMNYYKDMEEEEQLTKEEYVAQEKERIQNLFKK